MRVVKGVLKFWVLRIIDGENQLWTLKNKGIGLAQKKRVWLRKTFIAFQDAAEEKGGISPPWNSEEF